MSEFLNEYGSWILFGGLFLLMMRMHGGGGCCGGGHNHQDQKDEHGHTDHEHMMKEVEEIKEEDSANNTL